MSEQIKDGGPAFPRNYNADGHNGMTLRDYFAGKAMQSFIVTAGNGAKFGVGAVENNDTYSRASYAFADSMIAAREAES